MGANERDLLLIARFHHGVAQRGVQIFPRGKGPLRAGAGRDPRRMLEHRRDHARETFAIERVQLGKLWHRVFGLNELVMRCNGETDRSSLWQSARARFENIAPGRGPHDQRDRCRSHAQWRLRFLLHRARGDNTKVVPTDTIKNTINVLAKEHLGEEIERFALSLSEHFLNRYAQVRGTEIEIAERGWNRLEINGKPHPHSFRAQDEARRFTRVTGNRDAQTVQSGIRNLVILKSTASGFENYPKDEFTTLPETADRILATSFSATWTYAKAPANYDTAHAAILESMLKVFAETYSPSAQTTLFQMAEAALGSLCGNCADRPGHA